MCEFLSGQFVKSSTYKYNYFYDGSANPSAYRLKKGQQIANIYTAKKGTKKKKETLKAVNVVTMNPNVKYSIQIYKNPKTDIRKEAVKTCYDRNDQRSGNTYDRSEAESQTGQRRKVLYSY